MEDHLFYSQPTDLNVHLPQKYSHRNIQDHVWPNIWHSGPANLTHKINSHRGLVGVGEKQVGAEVTTYSENSGPAPLAQWLCWGAMTEMGTSEWTSRLALQVLGAGTVSSSKSVPAAGQVSAKLPQACVQQ